MIQAQIRTSKIWMCCLVALASCDSGEEKQPALVRPVRYLAIANGDGSSQRRFSGVAQAGTQSKLSFRVAGRVSEVSVRVGEQVSSGDVIATLDPSDYELQVREAQAAVAQARAQQRSAQAAFERTRALYENQNASRQDLDTARAAADSARSQVSSLGQRVQLLRRQLEYCSLRAPASGTISRVDVEPNENVTSGQVVAVLQAGERIEVRVALPGALVTKVHAEDPVKVAFADLGGKSFAGTVFEVSVAGETGASFPVTVRLGDGEKEVRAGMTADVTFQFAGKKKSVDHRVPTTAVGEDRAGRYVFVVKKEKDGFGTVHRRGVAVGGISSAGIRITKGIKDGDLVVVAGVSRISDGMRVKVPPLDVTSPQPAARKP